MSAVIAIVGRPNVGKSALFNRIAGKRIAIVHDEPGVTRDRISAEVEWKGYAFTLVDTGGIGLLRGEKTGDILTEAAYTQVQVAIEAASVIILVVNVQEGLVPLDIEVAARLRACGKPVIVAVNKSDAAVADEKAVDFSRLGFGTLLSVSAIHGRGIESLMDTATAFLPKEAKGVRLTIPSGDESWPQGPLKIAIVGRPNVGKSSLTNALTQSERVIVSPIPGTTRDSVDVPFEVEANGVKQNYILIDTAGLRKHRRVDNSIEFYSVTRAEESVVRSDIVVFVLDAEAGIMEQDKKVADLIIGARKACIVVVNKWDLVAEKVAEARAKEKERPAQAHSKQIKSVHTLAEYARWVQQQMFFLDYAPVIFSSAKEGINLDRLLEAIRFVADQLQQKIPTALLNRVLNEAIDNRQPVSDQGHFLKFFYATQLQTAPPKFLVFVNRNELLSPKYCQYLADSLRKHFGFEGCPIVIEARARPRNVEPVRRHQAARQAAQERNRRSKPGRRSRQRRG